MFEKIIEKVWGIVLLVMLFGFFLWGATQELDKPVPIYERGQIVGFATPEGEIFQDDPEFEEMVESYR